VTVRRVWRLSTLLAGFLLCSCVAATARRPAAIELPIATADAVATTQVRDFGYWMVATDGGVFAYAAAPFLGSAAGVSRAPVVALAPTPGRLGYWLVGLDGGVFSYGAAPFLGSAAGVSRSPVIGLAPTPDGEGYWLTATDGGVFSYGSAPFFGSAAGITTSAVTGIVATPTGRGYWLVALDGGVFAFGDARYFGSAATLSHNPVVGMAPTPSGQGYWLVATDGGVFSFGDAYFAGSGVGGITSDATGMTPTASGRGYWLVARNGQVTSYGDAVFAGTPAGLATGPVLGVARPGGPPSTGGGQVAAGSPGGPSIVALTFDDGPDPGHTPALLDTLSRLGVPATFFDVGVHASAYPELVRAEARRGHSVQNHTWGHRELAGLSGAGFGAQVDPAQALLGSLSGVAPDCVRPPDGVRSVSADRQLATRGLLDAGWNVDPQDWTGITATEIVRRVVAQLKPVSVVVLHDRSQITRALPALVTELRSRGYRFASICQTSGAVPG
jgi:peptidoglycan/xylan/chitin deacetylase (PgdA/CDA1 family)